MCFVEVVEVELVVNWKGIKLSMSYRWVFEELGKLEFWGYG